MGVLLSATLAEIRIVRMKNNVVTPSKPLFYKRYVDDIYNCCKRYITDTLLKIYIIIMTRLIPPMKLI